MLRSANQTWSVYHLCQSNRVHHPRWILFLHPVLRYRSSGSVSSQYFSSMGSSTPRECARHHRDSNCCLFETVEYRTLFVGLVCFILWFRYGLQARDWSVFIVCGGDVMIILLSIYSMSFILSMLWFKFSLGAKFLKLVQFLFSFVMYSFL